MAQRMNEFEKKKLCHCGKEAEVGLLCVSCDSRVQAIATRPTKNTYFGKIPTVPVVPDRKLFGYD
ncbi:hypothetical protein K2X83_02625 [Patescibacteria group bacterium]|nr:hypothetical protein [Patescibacteria group bacterium]